MALIRGNQISGSVASASFALTSSYSLSGNGFPYSGSAVITGSLLVSGSGITGSLFGTASYALTASYSKNLVVSGSINNVDYIDFNESAGVTVQPGQLAWNSSDGTLDLGLKGGNVTLQIGQETLYEVRNATGVTISNGTSLYASGVTAGSGRIEASPFTADGSIREVRFLGLATENIGIGVNGFVTHFGYTRGLDTRGTAVTAISVGDENWSVGDILYAHPTVAGKLTNVKPKHEISVAIVIVRHQTTGVLFVRPASFGHLEDNHDVNINTGSLSTGDLLIYDSGSAYWINSKQLTGSYALTGSLRATSFSGSFSGSGANLSDIPASGITGLNLSRIATGSVSASVSPGTASFAITSGSSTFLFVSSSGNVGIGTSTPSTKLHIAQTSEIGVRESLMKFSVSDAGNDAFYIGNGTSTDNTFWPAFAGYGESTIRSGIQFIGLLPASADASDSSNRGILNFEALRTNNGTDPLNGTFSAIQNRKIFTLCDINGPFITAYPSRNIAIGAEFTPSSRFQVRGSGATSATTALRIENTNASASLTITDDGASTFTAQPNATPITINGYVATGSAAQPALDITGSWNTSGAPTLIRASVNTGTSNNASLLMDLRFNGGSMFSVGQGGVVRGAFYNGGSETSNTLNTGFARSGGNNNTSGTHRAFVSNMLVSPTTGTGVFNHFEYVGIINQTGGANGITRGFYSNPTLTSAADWRSIEWSNNTGFGLYGAGGATNYLSGSLGIGTTTPSYKLDVSGSAKINEGIYGSGTTGNILPLATTTGTGTVVIGGISPNTPALRFQGSPLIFFIGSTQVAQLFATTGNLTLQNGGTFTDRGYRLDVSGSGNFTNNLTVTGSLIVSGSSTFTNIGPAVFSGSITQTASTASFGGNVGIGTTTPQYNLDVNGTTNLRNGLSVTGSFNLSGSSVVYGDLTVVGTASFVAVTSSIVTVGAATITLNTDAPSVRYGGINVVDSGSFGYSSTGSLLWDSERNRWIYSNPSGSTYDGGLLISGPRNTTGIGNEVGTTSNALMKGQGGDHITSSAAFEVSGSIGFGISVPSASLHISGASSANLLRIDSPAVNNILYVSGSGQIGFNQTSSTAQVTFKSLINSDVSEINTSDNGAYGFRSSGIFKGSSWFFYGSAGSIANASGISMLYFDSSRNVGLSVSSSLTSRFQVRGTDTTSATTAMRVENANASASLVVLDNGYVGIGTSTPSSSLSIYSGSSGLDFNPNTNTISSTSNEVKLFANSQNVFRGLDNWTGTWSDGATTTYFQTGRSGGNTAFSAFVGTLYNRVAFLTSRFQITNINSGTTPPTNYFQIDDNNTNLFSVTTTGRVGINNIDPSASLHVSGASSANLLRIDSPASSSIMFVSGSGNVGFGTSSPTQKVNVDGNILINGGNVLYLRDTTTYINEGSGLNLVSGVGRNIRFNAGGSDRMIVSASGQVGIGTSTPAHRLDVSGSARFKFTPSGTDLFTIEGAATTRYFIVENSNGYIGIGSGYTTSTTPSTPIDIRGNTSIRGGSATIGDAFTITNSAPTTLLTVQNTGNVGIGRIPTASLDIAGTTRISGSFNTAASGSILTVIGSGSAQPIFTVQGSQGELFSITDSLTGSLFSVNDISGLPILEVFSDNTTLIGNYQDPMLITTAKVVQTNSGSFTVYSLPTASYDTAFFEYSIKSGSNARAGTIMAIQLGSTVNFTETTTTDFGDTTAVSFTVIVTGSNMALTGSSTTGSWTTKCIVRGL